MSTPCPPPPLTTCTVASAGRLHRPRRKHSQNFHQHRLYAMKRLLSASLPTPGRGHRVFAAQSFPLFLLLPLKHPLPPPTPGTVSTPHCKASRHMWTRDSWLFDSKPFPGLGARCDGLRGAGSLLCTPSTHILYLFDAFSFGNQNPQE